jgi:hypothetical protein
MLTSSDILAIPEPEVQTFSKEFEIGGKSYTFIISNSPSVYAEHFYMMINNMNKVATDKVQPLRVMLPNGKEIVIEQGIYLSMLKNLHMVLIEPKLRLEELAILGHKIGGVKMGEILAWANGSLSGAENPDGIDEAKNE